MSVARELPVWRSALFVPVNVDRFVASAPGRGADALIIDLEDSVAVADKNAARELVPGVVQQFHAAGRSDVLVRINQPLELAVRDLEAAVIRGVDALVIPKVEGPDHLRLLDELVTRLETSRGLHPGYIRFLGLIETPGPLANAMAIARATPRLAAISLGWEDYATAIGAKPTEENLRLPSQQVLQAACAAGILPLGTLGSVAGFTDLDEYTRIVTQSADSGFLGAACVHPSQVAILNAGFCPSDLDVQNAGRIVALAQAAAASHRGALAIDGRMIDLPVVQRATNVLARARAIAKRQTDNEARRGQSR